MGPPRPKIDKALGMVNGNNGGCQYIPFLSIRKINGQGECTYVHVRTCTRMTQYLPKMDCEIMLVKEPLAAEMTFVPKLARVVVGLVRGHSRLGAEVFAAIGAHERPGAIIEIDHLERRSGY